MQASSAPPSSPLASYSKPAPPDPSPHLPGRYALPRPEGQRCLVVAARGQTLARRRNGSLLERFASPLPAGGPGQAGGGDDSFCILDCVFHEADDTYYVMGGLRVGGGMSEVALGSVGWRGEGDVGGKRAVCCGCLVWDRMDSLPHRCERQPHSPPLRLRRLCCASPPPPPPPPQT